MRNRAEELLSPLFDNPEVFQDYLETHFGKEDTGELEGIDRVFHMVHEWYDSCNLEEY